MKREDLDFLKTEDLSRGLKEDLAKALKVSTEQISASWQASLQKMGQSLGSAFESVCSQSIKKGLESFAKSAQDLSSSLLSQLKSCFPQGSFFNSFLSSPMLGGAVKVGLGTLFEGVLSFFKTLSQQKKEEIEKIYKEKLDSIKANFDKEIALRSENIKNLDKKLSAFSQAFQSGQIGAQEYYQISQQINQEKKQEELEQARSKKLQELKSLELTREKEYKLEEAKWFPNKNKLAQLQEEINKLKSRQTKASQANSLEEIHLASQGALTRVNKPTLFLAGEKGDELVKIKPLQAPIHPFLEEAKQQPFAPVFHFNISGFVGDEIALSRRLTQMIQSSIHILGEREFKP